LCVYKETLRFLNLPYDGQTNFQKKNSQRRYNNAFWQGLYSGSLLRPLGNLLTKHPVRLARVQRFTRPIRKMIKRKNSTEITLPELDPNFAARLLKVLGEDIDGLSCLLDRDLTHWLAAGDPLRRGLICQGKSGLG
jgi:hypothetical protein